MGGRDGDPWGDAVTVRARALDVTSQAGGGEGAAGAARALARLLAACTFPLVLAGCAWNAAGSTGCAPEGPAALLPPGLEEASGATPSAHDPDLFWTHGDSGGEPDLWLVDRSGRARLVVRLDGVRPVDPEALAGARCPEGRCLYVADTGDNALARADPAIHRLVEPAPPPRSGDAEGISNGRDRGRERVARATRAARAVPRIRRPATSLPVAFPDGPRDVEAIFVLPGERIHLVSKGRSHPVTVYRYPLPLRPGERVTLEAVQTLTGDAPSFGRRVTGAAAWADGGDEAGSGEARSGEAARRSEEDSDGIAVVVRTYETLRFHRVDDGRLVPLEGGEVRLRTLREPQGEGVALAPDGRVLLVSEAGPLGRRGSVQTLRCSGPPVRR